jgi:hypothetical protein
MQKYTTVRELALAALAGVAIALLFSWACGGLDAQTRKEPLPRGWAKIGLTKDQELKVRSAQKDYARKIDDALKQVETLKKERDQALVDILTTEQRTQLVKMYGEGAIPLPRPKDEAKK